MSDETDEKSAGPRFPDGPRGEGANDAATPVDDRGSRPDAPDKPAGSSDLLPKKLYVAELLLLPFFWFGPLLLVGLGGVMALDLRSLSDRLDVEVGSAQYFLCLSPMAVGYLGSIGYRARRRRLVQKSVGLSPAAARRQWKQFDTPRGLAVKGLFVARLLLGIAILVGVVVLPTDLVSVLLVLLGLELLLVLATPPFVFLDLRAVREIDGVSWGWPGYVHLVTSMLPLGLFVYLIQRTDHLNYALAIDVWDVAEEELAVDDSEKGALASISERIESALY